HRWFAGERLQSMTARGRATSEGAGARRESSASRSENLVELCEDLLSRRGEASGVALAREILSRYAQLTMGPRVAFFEALATRFGPSQQRLAAAIEDWRRDPSEESTAELHGAAESRRQELFRRIHLAA